MLFSSSQMRTRTKLQILERRVWSGISAANNPNTYTTCTGTVYASSRAFGAHDIVSEVRDERISDSLGKGMAHPCVHRRHTRKLAERPGGAFMSPATNVAGTFGVEVNSPGSSPWWDQFQTMANTSLAWDVVGNSVPPMWSISTTNIDENQIIEQLLDRARQLKADVLLNLVEANQIWPSINSLVNSLPNMAKHWRELRKVLRTASGAFLAWKFGVSPILSDIMAIQRYLPRMHSDIVRHEKGDKSRFSTVAELPCSFNPPVHVPLVWNGHNITDRIFSGRIQSAPKMRFVLVVKPSAKGLTGLNSKLGFLSSRFGSSPASLAWELVPFSFVIDWFVDLRGALRAVDNIIGHEPYKVVSFTKSLSYELAADDRWKYMSPCTGSTIVDLPLGSATYRNYERSIVSNPGIFPVWRPRFGNNQAGISAALITQKLTQLFGAKR